MPLSGSTLYPTNAATSESFATVSGGNIFISENSTVILVVLSETGVASLSHTFELDAGPIALTDSTLYIYRRICTTPGGETYTVTQNSAGRCLLIYYQPGDQLYPVPLVAQSTPTVDGAVANGESLSTGFTAEQAEWNVLVVAAFAAENQTDTTIPTWGLYTNSFTESTERSAAGTGEAKTLACAHSFPQHYGPYETEAVLSTAVAACSTAAVVVAYVGVVDPPYFVTGFEPGTLLGATVGAQPLYSSITGAPTITSSPVASGSYALRCTSTAATCAVGVDPSLMGVPTTPCIGTVKVLSLGALPAADVDLVTLQGSFTSFALRFRASDGVFTADQAGGTGSPSVGPAWTADTFAVLEWMLTSAGVLAWRVNGVAQNTYVGGQVSSFLAAYAGWALNPATADVVYDDWCLSAIAGDYPMGAAKVVLLKVDPAGTVAVNTPTAFSLMSANGTINSTFNVTTARDALDEVPPSIGATADGIVQDAADVAAHVDIPMTTYTLLGGEAVLGLRPVFVGWAVSTTAATLGFRVWNGIVEETLQAGTVNPLFNNSTTAPGWFAKQATLTNFDTQAKLDACQLRVGYSSDATPDIGVQWAGAELAIGSAIAIPGVTKRRRKGKALYRR